MATKERYFNVICKIEPTGERFPLKNLHNDMKIKDLKAYSEFATGIPVNLQRLCYLDEGDLLDDSDLKHNEIVPGSALNLKVWHTWTKLIKAAALNDLDTIFELGVTYNSDFSTPNADYMAQKNPRLRQEWLAQRAFVALYIAAHRGHHVLCDKLLATGADVNATTPYGRSALHVAAARGHGKIVDLLLEKGADIDARDRKGDTPLSISSKFGNKTCERHLFLFRWQQRAKETLRNKIHVGMFAHQYFDSVNPVWLKGKHGQIYYTQILPPGEFEGTALGAPRRKMRPVSAPDETRTIHAEDGNLNSTESENGSRRPSGMPPIKEDMLEKRATTAFPGSRQRTMKKGSGQTFDDWLRRKKHEEQTKIEQKKAEKKRLQQLEEYKSYIRRAQQLAIQEESYEKWLANRHEHEKLELKSSGMSENIPKAAFSRGETMGEMGGRSRQPVIEQEYNPLDLWKAFGKDNFYSELKAHSRQFSNYYQMKPDL